MKINHYKRAGSAAFVLLAVVLSVSCKKYLNKKQNSSLIVPATLTDLQALLDDATMYSSSTPSYGETSADDYFITDDTYNSLWDPSYQYWYTWRPYFSGSENDWQYGYRPVYNANLVLDQMKDIPVLPSNKAEWENVKGSALFYRAYYFLVLLWNYAKAYDSATANTDLGIVLRLSSDFNIPSVRSTNEQCYRQVLTDAGAAVKLLPDYPQVAARPSKTAAYGLLARCCLSMRDYKNALLYADSCLQLNNQLMDYNGDEDVDAAATDPFSLFNKETIFYTTMNNIGLLFKTSNGEGRIDTSLYASYAVNDLRQQLFFKDIGDGYRVFAGSYSANYNQYFSGIATDEIYLIRSECYIRRDKLQQGLDDLNKLLSKRYVSGTFTPLTFASREDALEFVLKERRKELVMRGLRWMDVKRLNKEGREIVLKRLVNGEAYLLQPNSNFYALPLPDDIIKLTGMPQNE